MEIVNLGFKVAFYAYSTVLFCRYIFTNGPEEPEELTHALLCLLVAETI